MFMRVPETGSLDHALNVRSRATRLLPDLLGRQSKNVTREVPGEVNLVMNLSV